MPPNIQTIWLKIKKRHNERWWRWANEKSNKLSTLIIHGNTWSQLNLNGVWAHTNILKHKKYS